MKRIVSAITALVIGLSAFGASSAAASGPAPAVSVMVNPGSPTNCRVVSVTVSSGKVVCLPGAYNGKSQFRAVARYISPSGNGYAYGPWTTCCASASVATIPLWAVIEGGRVTTVGWQTR